MQTFASKLMPLAVASVICGIALAGGGKDEHMKMMDSNDDGKVTAAEHAAGAKMMFTKMDSNRDGRVTASEMDAAQPMMKDHGDRPEPTAGRQDAASEDSHKAGMMSSAQKIAMIDTDGDGELTAEEHATGSKQMFTKMDTNSDGALTAQELREGHRSMMSAHDD